MSGLLGRIDISVLRPPRASGNAVMWTMWRSALPNIILVIAECNGFPFGTADKPFTLLVADARPEIRRRAQRLVSIFLSIAKVPPLITLAGCASAIRQRRTPCVKRVYRVA